MTLAVRHLAAADVAEADRLFRLAFGTFLGLPDPQSFTGDADIVGTRFRANPALALGAYRDDVLVGSSFATCWGSFGFVGPVSVDPELWDKGVAKLLMTATVGVLEQAKVRQSALITFSHSAKHIALYQKFDFWPQYLTPVMSKPVASAGSLDRWLRFSSLDEAGQAARLSGCARLTGALLPGLDLAPEIDAIVRQGLGETILLEDGDGIAAFATCHIGKGSEAGSNVLFVKFAAVRPGAEAPSLFARLLDACEALAAQSGCRDIAAGVNTARHEAYRQMIGRGFRAFMEGIAMLRPNQPGYNRPDCFVIDDLR
ncbi:MAG: GNAT family N-acetyltransferase [Reyranellaceae bacterium]